MQQATTSQPSGANTRQSHRINWAATSIHKESRRRNPNAPLLGWEPYWIDAAGTIHPWGGIMGYAIDADIAVKMCAYYLERYSYPSAREFLENWRTGGNLVRRASLT